MYLRSAIGGQEDLKAAEYALTFRTVAASSRWNEPALLPLLLSSPLPVSLPFWWLWIDFPNPAVLSISLVSLLLSRSLQYYSSRSPGIMAFRRTSSPTVAPNSHHGYGEPLWRNSGSRSGGEDEPEAGEAPEESLSGPAGRVGPIPSMDGVRPEFATSLLHWADPFQCVLGFQPALAPWTPDQTEAPVVDEWFRRSEVWSDAHVRLQCSVHRQKEQAYRHRSLALP
jgi:hypothetical protein